MNDSKIQKRYYTDTALSYDKEHLSETSDPEHKISLVFLEGLIKLYNISSILDVGAGTGRTIQFVKERFPEITIRGIEPIKELREIGYQKGISKLELLDGDGYNLDFKNSEFDLVCEFAVLHHVRTPEKVLNEMIRVAKKGIFISDSNNFGQGKIFFRFLKKFLRLSYLWNIYQFARTKGKMYYISQGDGLFYSYSVFTNYKRIRKSFKEIQLLSYVSEGLHPLYNSPHVALFAHSKLSSNENKLQNE